VRGAVNGLNPWPCAKVTVGGETLKLMRAGKAEGAGRPGEILRADPKQGLVIACGDGAVKILEIQAPGGKKMRAEDYLRGHAMETGRILTRE